MNEKTIIGIGLILFLAAMSFPVWYTAAAGGNPGRPELEKPVGETQCVEEKEFMTANHMQLLNEWRNAVVRDGRHPYTSKAYGVEHEMSLTKSCLRCHTQREKFCNQCHNYADVHPKCWDCHVDPAED